MVLYPSVHIHHHQVWSSYKTEQVQTAPNGEKSRNSCWCSPGHSPWLVLHRNQTMEGKITTEPSQPGHYLFNSSLLAGAIEPRTPKLPVISAGSHPHKQLILSLWLLPFKSNNMLFMKLLHSTSHLQILYCKNNHSSLHPHMLVTLLLFALLCTLTIYILCRPVTYTVYFGFIWSLQHDL